MDRVLILDFGSQYTQLIARKVRELNVFSEIKPFCTDIEEIKEFDPKAIILSGSPASTFDKNAPQINKHLFDLKKPILGICYGMQITALYHKGQIKHKSFSQYGPSDITITEKTTLFKGCSEIIKVWMSHGDTLTKLPEGFREIARAEEPSGKVIAAIENLNDKIWGLQFHPEVHHTPLGKTILGNFLNLSGIKRDFLISKFAENKIEEIRKKVSSGKVICALSGGVDSSVTARLIQKAIGENLICIFVNNGLLRKNESAEVLELYESMKLNIKHVDASELFLKNLKGVKDPEEKRKIIGKTFIDVFEKEKESIEDVRFLAQGTTYPDIIESVSIKGPSSTIKSHHNVGGLPEKMNLKLLEPIKELFKDEVRELGRTIKVPERTLMRHPFPGPGLGIRILGEVTKEAVLILQEADSIVTNEILKANLYDKIWQLATIFLPVKTVGVKGDERSYENVVAIRAVDSVDGMTADFIDLPHSTLRKISNRIINEVKGVNRVVYDISSKPPATIEWE